MSTEDEVISRFNKITNLNFDLAKQYYFQYIRTDKKVPNNTKLEFYKYYKQTTLGDCYYHEPWFYEFKKKAKWNAWDSVKGMSILDASNEYVSLYDSVKK